jgi:hypothetical protein
VSMHTITVVTLVFLPATFLCVSLPQPDPLLRNSAAY